MGEKRDDGGGGIIAIAVRWCVCRLQCKCGWVSLKEVARGGSGRGRRWWRWEEAEVQCTRC